MAAIKTAKLTLPAATEDLRKLEIGTVVHLTGRVFTAREGVYKRAIEDSLDRKSTRLNSSHRSLSRMPSSA